MIIAFAPPPVIAVQSAAGSSSSVVFAPPPQSALTGVGSLTPVKVATTRASTAAQLTTAQPPAVAADDAAALNVAPTAALPTPAGLSPMMLLRTTLASTKPLVGASGGATAEPAAGLWVLATAGCPLPMGTDLNAWAECTQPLGFNGGELAVLEKPKAGNKAQTTGGLYSIARTRYRATALPTSAGATLPGLPGPELVQVEVPGLTGRSYIYVAVRPEIVDGEGRFVSARAWPVACPPPATPDVSRRGDRCVAATLKAVADASGATPADGGYLLRWIDPTDAGSAGDTGGGRTYAPPPAPVYKAPRKLSPLEAAEPLPITDLPPDLAAQQPQTPSYGPREEGGDDAPVKATKPAAKPAAKAKKKS